MGFRLTWSDDNTGEDGHRVYRSTSPMDPQNLPAHLVELGADVTSYDDGAVTPGQTYYYRVSAFVGGIERVSDELQVVAQEEAVATSGLVFHPDMKNAPSGGVVTDLAGNYDGTVGGDPSIIVDDWGKGMLFDGVDDYLDFGDIMQFIWRGQPFAMSAVFRLVNPTSTVATHILSNSLSSANPGFMLGTDNRALGGSDPNLTNDAFRGFLSNGVSSQSVECYYNQVDMTGMHVMTFMSDGTDTYIYRGDELMNTVPLHNTTGTEVADYPVRMAAVVNSSERSNIVVYNMRVYNRMLTAAELRAIKNEVQY